MLQLNSKTLQGLSELAAAEKLKTEGYNELLDQKKRTALTMLFEVAREPMFFLLLVSGGLYLALGDVHEAIMLLVAIFMVIGITLYQENKTENALAALKDLSSPMALVIREGRQRLILSREVVVGDLVIIAEGERVPADGRLLQTANLSVDESLLTGESVPVLKNLIKAKAKELGENSVALVFSGSLVTTGQGIFKVTAVGFKTEMGKIGHALGTIKVEASGLQKQTRVVVRNFALVGLVVCLFVFVYFSITHDDWLNGLLAGLTLAMSMMPEEFPVVLTVFLSLGAWRISRHKVLARRIPVVETLGAITTLCVDKTGTLTMNKMAVDKIGVGQEIIEIKEHERFFSSGQELIKFALLATPLSPFDPMEKAINELDAGNKIVDRLKYKFIKGYPLSDNLLTMSNVWQNRAKAVEIAAKGSPEAIMEICHLTKAARTKIELQIDQLAASGLRVLGVAKGRANGQLPDEQHDLDFEFLGLLGLADPIRPEVPAAIKECYSAGIKVMMITGDYPGTARMIAEKIGFKNLDKLITGTELAQLTAQELGEKIKEITIFARIKPEQKLIIVQALKAANEVVAMTGDGVNDAPALKAADIGIAMGKRGSAVAREASDMILLDDNFASIVAAIRMGRRIYDNLKKAITFIFSVHIPIAGISILSVVMGWPLMLLPIHIVFLEMIIDPACSIAFEMEKAEADLMSRKPRKLNSRFFSRTVILTGLIQGLAVFMAVGLIYGLSLKLGLTENQARVFGFFNLVLGNLGLILINRSRSKSVFYSIKQSNSAWLWIVSSVAFFLFLSLATKFTRTIFKFESVVILDLGLSFLVILAAIAVSEVLKLTLVKRLSRA